MHLTNNTIFITGGGSGIGRALAEALHQRGNQVIISGRRASHLAAVTAANPGMASIELDITSLVSIQACARKLIADFPELNVLINNAGIMMPDNVDQEIDDALMLSIIETNLMGPIRMTSALIEHLKKQPSSTVINVTSGLAYVPLAPTAVYSATKAALHSFTLSQRFMLRNSNVKFQEIAPPWVQTDLMGSKEEPRAMKLADFMTETMQALANDTPEVLVERATILRNNPGPNEHAFVIQFNNMLTEQH